MTVSFFEALILKFEFLKFLLLFNLINDTLGKFLQIARFSTWQRSPSEKKLPSAKSCQLNQSDFHKLKQLIKDLIVGLRFTLDVIDIN